MYSWTKFKKLSRSRILIRTPDQYWIPLVGDLRSPNALVICHLLLPTCCEGCCTYGMMMSLRNFGMGLASISTRTWNDNIVIQVSPSSPQVSMYWSPRPKIPDWNVLYTQQTTLSRISHDQQFFIPSQPSERCSRHSVCRLSVRPSVRQ